jgi:SAM-dependent methyltransferase
MNTSLRRLLVLFPPSAWLVRFRRRSIRWRKFRRDFREFQSQSATGQARFALRWSDRFPCLDDNTGYTSFDWHYVFHTAWAARLVAANSPARHIDIASSLYFNALVSAFVPVDFYEYRPVALNLSGLENRHADLLALPFKDQSVPSLSCMHVVEHIGLGRYGEPIDADGDLKAMAELRRVLAPGGALFFVVPVGRPRLQFNAHRIYSHRQIVEAFAGLELAEFSLQPDFPRCELVRHASPELAAEQRYGCGCFHFVRPL